MKKTAFTLAEVLIVMALIGFLFTLMIPNLAQKRSSTKFIEQAQIAQTKLQDAITKTAAENNDSNPMDWESVRASENKSEAIIKAISKKLSIMSYCGGSPRGCFASTDYRTLNGKVTTVITDEMEDFSKTAEPEEYKLKIKKTKTDDEGYSLDYTINAKYTDADPEKSTTYINLLEGGSIALKTNSTYCDGIVLATDPLERQYCAQILVDINGPAIPNMLGVDVFGFYLAGNTVLPMGFYGDEFNFEGNCLRETPNADKYNGLACTAWALKTKNMDYRKCQAGTRIGWALSPRCEIKK